jgi:hypothetical protein
MYSTPAGQRQRDGSSGADTLTHWPRPSRYIHHPWPQVLADGSHECPRPWQVPPLPLPDLTGPDGPPVPPPRPSIALVPIKLWILGTSCGTLDDDPTIPPRTLLSLLGCACTIIHTSKDTSQAGRAMDSLDIPLSHGLGSRLPRLIQPADRPWAALVPLSQARFGRQTWPPQPRSCLRTDRDTG